MTLPARTRPFSLEELNIGSHVESIRPNMLQVMKASPLDADYQYLELYPFAPKLSLSVPYIIFGALFGYKTLNWSNRLRQIPAWKGQFKYLTYMLVGGALGQLWANWRSMSSHYTQTCTALMEIKIAHTQERLRRAYELNPNGRYLAMYPYIPTDEEIEEELL